MTFTMPRPQAEKAEQACMQCRKLKRKCPRELPFCSLCTRLNKSCEYTSKGTRISYDESTESPSEPLSGGIEQEITNNSFSGQSFNNLSALPNRYVPQHSKISSPSFPVQYFLDSESHVPISAVLQHHSIPIPQQILDILRLSSSMESLVGNYFQGVHDSLPMLSQKRIIQNLEAFNPESDAGLTLLLLCMNLVSEVPSTGKRGTASSNYCLAKEFCFKVENMSLISLQLLQSIVLIALYEIGNAILPAGYLTIGHAARLAIMMGLHDRKNSAKLFKGAETWSQSEEERRTWWSIVILDRYINIGISGLHQAVPSPPQGTLLPCPDSRWNKGELGFNVSLFASSFAADTEISSFANACQASHLLGLILQHRDEGYGNTDRHFQVIQALGLHQTLAALNTHLNEKGSQPGKDNNTEIATALCCAARLILYGMYGCYDHYVPGQARLPEEVQMQRTSLEGLREVAHDVYLLAQSLLDSAVTDTFVLSRSLLVCHCLYLAGSELVWFIKEDRAVEEIRYLKVIIELLRAISRRWLVAEEYISCLVKEGAMVYLEN